MNLKSQVKRACKSPTRTPIELKPYALSILSFFTLSTIVIDTYVNREIKLPECSFTFDDQSIELNLNNNIAPCYKLPSASFSNLLSLKKIHLNCFLKTIPENIFNNSRNIQEIYLENNYFEKIPENLFHDQEELRTLDLSNNSLIELPKNLFKNNKQLIVLILFKNSLKELPKTLFYDQKKLTELDLSNNRLAELPESLFDYNYKLRVLKLCNNQLEVIKRNIFSSLLLLEEIYISNNQLTTIDAHTFDKTHSLKIIELQNNQIKLNAEEISLFSKLQKIEVLKLRNNSIKELILPGSYFKDRNANYIPSNFTHLDLRSNQFEVLNDETLTYLSECSTLKTLQLSNNPWHCDCKASPFLQYVHSNNEKFIDLKNIICSAPFNGKKFLNLFTSDICYMDQKTILLLSTLAIFFFIIIILFIFYRKYEIEIKVWLYANNMCQWFVNEEELDKDKLYDVFIAYSSKDEVFVVEKLVPNLENGTPSFKTCVHYRDFFPGQNIGDNIAHGIYNSRRTIVVLSKNFLESYWARAEFRTAHLLALKERKQKIIIILLDDIGNIEDLDPELKPYLKMNAHLSVKDSMFWEHLHYAMPHSTISRNNLNKNHYINNKLYDHELELINLSSSICNTNQESQETDV